MSASSDILYYSCRINIKNVGNVAKICNGDGTESFSISPVKTPCYMKSIGYCHDGEVVQA